MLSFLTFYLCCFSATDLGHVDVTGSDAQISLVQRNHSHFFFDPNSRNVTLIKELNTDKDSVDLDPLILDCYIVGEPDPVGFFFSLSLKICPKPLAGYNALFKEEMPERSCKAQTCKPRTFDNVTV